MIVIEGLDATGKSTLAKLVAQRCSALRVQESEGPPRSRYEILHRIQKYALLPPAFTLFVRHPCVSNPIYDLTRPDDKIPIPQRVIDEFYETKHTFIYCEDPAISLPHEAKEHDSATHLADVTRNRAIHKAAYDAWADRYATFRYRIPADPDPVVSFILERFRENRVGGISERELPYSPGYRG